MRHRNFVGLSAALCLLAGCNQPAVAPKAPAFQSSENTVRDWNDVAQKIAAEMAARGLLQAMGPAEPATPTSTRPIFVRVQAPDSTFLQQLAGALEGAVLKRGAAVSRTPSGATVVNLDVDFLRWSPRDKPPGLLGTMAAAVAIPGIVIAASAPMSTWTAANAAIFGVAGLGIVGDAAIALLPTTNAEAVWRATIVTDDRVVMKLQEPVYVRENDIPLYAKATSLSPVASWNPAETSLEARRLGYVQ